MQMSGLMNRRTFEETPGGGQLTIGEEDDGTYINTAMAMFAANASGRPTVLHTQAISSTGSGPRNIATARAAAHGSRRRTLEVDGEPRVPPCQDWTIQEKAEGLQAWVVARPRHLERQGPWLKVVKRPSLSGAND